MSHISYTPILLDLVILSFVFHNMEITVIDTDVSKEGFGFLFTIK
jgi:hypothetical protein